MGIGIALYHTDNLLVQQAYHLATLFFKSINQNITNVSYSSDFDTYHSLTIDDLIQATHKDEVRGFRLYSKNENNPPWVVSFGCRAHAKTSLNYIDIQCAFDLSEEQTILFFKEALTLGFIPYGIGYVSDNVVDAYEYVMEEGIIPLPSYEQHFLWRDETPEFQGYARYLDSMLRMVYPYNLINKNHLSIRIENQTLADKIQEDEHFGELISTPNTESFIWKVNKAQLEYVNKVCGEAGTLIAWQK